MCQRATKREVTPVEIRGFDFFASNLFVPLSRRKLQDAACTSQTGSHSIHIRWSPAGPD